MKINSYHNVQVLEKHLLLIPVHKKQLTHQILQDLRRQVDRLDRLDLLDLLDRPDQPDQPDLPFTLRNQPHIQQNHLHKERHRLMYKIAEVKILLLIQTAINIIFVFTVNSVK